MSTIRELVEQKTKDLEEKGYHKVEGMAIVDDVVFTSFTFPCLHLRTFTLTNITLAEIINASDTSDWYIFRKYNLEQLK